MLPPRILNQSRTLFDLVLRNGEQVVLFPEYACFESRSGVEFRRFEVIGRWITCTYRKSPHAASVAVFPLVLRVARILGRGEPASPSRIIAVSFEIEFDLTFAKNVLALLLLIPSNFGIGLENTGQTGTSSDLIPIFFDIRIIGIIFVESLDIVEQYLSVTNVDCLLYTSPSPRD